MSPTDKALRILEIETLEKWQFRLSSVPPKKMLKALTAAIKSLESEIL